MRRARQRAGEPPGTSMPGWNTARIATILLLVLAAAAIGLAAIGLTVTQREDSRREIERHAALQDTLDELHAVFGDVDHFDPRQLRLIERRAVLVDLHFDADLVADGNREVQSLHGPQGRIIGWFSWLPDRALAHAMNWLWGFAGAVGAGLAFCAFLAVRSTRRLGGSLARSMESIRKLTTQDILTGLPNRGVILARLEAAAATRRSKVVSFALIDIDSFGDVNDTLGRAGGDTMLVNIGERLKLALPAGVLFGRFEDDVFAVIAESES